MKIYNHIKHVLERDEKLCKGGKLFKNVVVEAGLKLDPDLLSILLSDETAKQYFFTDVNGVFVFDKVKFQRFVSNKQFLPDSYTAYKNKIGLTADHKYLTEANEVVLDFPYKDCVLAGGQTKDDQKRQEIFWNETLAPDEIDLLFEPKVLTHWKRFDKDGEHEVKNISLQDNLIIKGNNLIALHSLKKVYKEKIKLIYIDPPYNTGNDSFNYNDSFNHSTWLTFMKNRLEVARELLREDGVIFVQCDDNEQAYLKVLMDSIFGRSQTDCMVWRKSGVGRDGKMKNTTTFRKDHEYLVLAFRDKKLLNKSMEKPNWQNAYPNPDKDPRGNYKAGSISRREEASNPNHRNYYTVKSPGGKEFTRQFDVSKEDFTRLNNDSRIYWGTNQDSVPSIKIFENEERETNASSLILFNGTSTEGKKEIENLFQTIDEFMTPKPESVLKKIIQISTQPDEIVLDFFAGSGTTGAVAHKMNRRYILIEQMHYIHDLPEARLKKVIDGEQGGISKSVDWSGGGSFIYAELAQNTDVYKNQIAQADDKQALSLWQELKENPYISYKADFQKTNDDEFSRLSLEHKKEILKSLIDQNMLYVPYSERDDRDYEIDEEDKKITTRFYGM